ncbi:MAG: phasin family protein [Rhizobiales bacterium]|nr:phasin family protein [Hyphomicrobiales bacterium]
MANSKKPPFVAPAKPAPVAPIAANPAISPVKPVPAATVAPGVIKPAPAASAPVVAAKFETPKVDAPKIAPVKAEPAKVEAVKVEPVKMEPVKVEASKPAAPVAAKVEAPAAPKPVAPVQKPVEAAKVPVVAKAPVLPKAVEAAPKPAGKPAPKAATKSTDMFPIADVMKPVAMLQENVRANTEKALSEFRGRYAEVKGFAETATTRLEDSMKAAQSGSREIGFALFEIVKAQTHANLDHAKTLAGAKSIPDLVKAQQAFVLSQFQSAQTRSKDVATLAGKIANDVTSPLRASFELILRR